MYKGEKYIKRFINNINRLNDTEGSEIIFVINESEQNEIEEEEILKIQNINYKIIKTKLCSIYESWNIGIKESNNEYISNCNIDDVIHPDFIFKIKSLYKKYKNKPDIIAGWDVLITDENELFSDDLSYNRPKYQEYFCESKNGIITLSDSLVRCYFGCHPVWKKSLHGRFGWFSSDFGPSGDYEFWLRCQYGGAIGFLSNDIVGGYYFNPGGLSTNASEKEKNLEIDKKIKEMYKI